MTGWTPSARLGLGGVVAVALATSPACDRDAHRGPRRDASDAAPRAPIDQLVLVSAGWFTGGCLGMMGDRDELEEVRARAERCVILAPPRRLWLSAFEVQRREVSTADYLACVAANACQDQDLLRLRSRDPRSPAEVPHHEADAYCRWRNLRLPSAAEWQKAARGTDERLFPWGDDPPDCLLAAINAPGCDGFGPVGQHPRGRSPFGAEDMFGNADEWVADRSPAKLDSVHGQPVFESEATAAHIVLRLVRSSIRVRWADHTAVDPAGPRGASDAEGQGDYLALGAPGIADAFPARADSRLGFRCVRSVPGPTPPSPLPVLIDDPPTPAGRAP